MPTVSAFRAFHLRHWLGTLTLPCTCHVCGTWQSQPICQTCFERWQDDKPRCVRCAIGLEHPNEIASDLCHLCQDQSPEFDRAIAAFDYVSPWKEVLASFKFREHTALVKPLSQRLSQTIAQRKTRVDLIVPIPLSNARLQERGFNQTWLLTQALSEQLGIPARFDVLARDRHTDRLMRMDADARQQHIAGAFKLMPHAELDVLGCHVAIVDDVLTTGATMNEAALTLREAGAKSVSAWVLARTPSHAR